LDKSANDIGAVIEIVLRVKSKITDNSNMSRTIYDNAETLRTELDDYIQQLQKGNIDCLQKLHTLFLPTSSSQEHSISNCWQEEYIAVSATFDKYINDKSILHS
jgi:hypothetical protein